MKIDAQKVARRIPTSHIPREVATRALLSPRITGKSRRLFMRARDQVVDIPKAEPAGAQEVFCKYIRRLTMQQLGRRLTQLTHYLSDAKRKLALAELDQVRKGISDFITMLEYQIGWLKQEADRRANGVLKESIDDAGN